MIFLQTLRQNQKSLQKREETKGRRCLKKIEGKKKETIKNKEMGK